MGIDGANPDVFNHYYPRHANPVYNPYVQQQQQRQQRPRPQQQNYEPYPPFQTNTPPYGIPEPHPHYPNSYNCPVNQYKIDISKLQATVADYLKSLQPHKEKYEKLTHVFAEFYERLGANHTDRYQLDVFKSHLRRIQETLDEKHLEQTLKVDISKHLIDINHAADRGQYDRILPGLEALLAVLNNFQEMLVTNLARKEQNAFEKETAPSMGFGMMHRLLEEASQNTSPELSSPCQKKLTTVKLRTKRLREKIIKEGFGIEYETAPTTANSSIDQTKNCRLQEAKDAYLLEMRRLTKSEFCMPPCFPELTDSSFMKLFADCAGLEQLNRYVARNTPTNLPAFLDDLPLVYIANMCFPAYDPATESAHGTKAKLQEEKFRAVENLIKSISPNLNEDTRQDLAVKILNEIRPAKWSLLCEQAVVLVFGAVGLVSIRKAAEFGGKTTIDKLGRQIIVDIASRWALVDEHKAEELAIVKAHYRITFVTAKNVGIKDDPCENCGEVKLSISVSNFKQKHPSLFQKNRTKLDGDKALLASLLSGTFEQKKKEEKRPLVLEPPPPQPRHEKQPSEPIFPSSRNRRTFDLLPDMPPLFPKTKYHPSIISPPINEYYPGGGVHQRQVSGLSGAPALPVSQSLDAQFKARSWPRNPGTNSLGIQFLPDDPEVMKYAEKVIAQPSQGNYQPAPAPGVIPDSKSYPEWNDENGRTLKDSLKDSTLGESSQKDFFTNGELFDDESSFEQLPFRAPASSATSTTSAHRRNRSWTGVNDGYHL